VRGAEGKGLGTILSRVGSVAIPGKIFLKFYMPICRCWCFFTVVLFANFLVGGAKSYSCSCIFIGTIGPLSPWNRHLCIVTHISLGANDCYSVNGPCRPAVLN